MKLKSLGLTTELIFMDDNCSIIDRGSYTVIKTPSNPSYFWGNYLVFDKPPINGDFNKWHKIFDEEFKSYPTKPKHYLFAWETESTNQDLTAFKNAYYKYEKGVALSTTKINPPPKINNEVEVKKISIKDHLQEIIQHHKACADPSLVTAYYDEFKEKQFNNYIRLVDEGRGHWFGAFLNNKLVADLGIFHKDGVARYQLVGTHPDYRRQGICGTLVYKAGLVALTEYNAKTLVMVADDDYHAARIYESVGFKPNDYIYSFCIWDGLLNAL